MTLHEFSNHAILMKIDNFPFCDRRLWKDVTYNLKINDIDSATIAKSGLEHRQRTEAAERKEKNVKWETKLFQPIGENWQFMNPLEKRLMEEGTAGMKQ